MGNIKAFISAIILIGYVVGFVYVKYLKNEIEHLQNDIKVEKAQATYNCVKKYTDKEIEDVKNIKVVIDDDNSTIDFDELW